MSAIIAKAVELVRSGKASCTVIKDGKIIKTVNGRGIKPIVDMYDEGILCGATVVDKVVGRASAMVMALGGVKYCYALLISDAAKTFFDQSGIKSDFESRCEYIVNRTGDGRCPMESAVQGIDSPNQALIAVREKLKELSQKQ